MTKGRYVLEEGHEQAEQKKSTTLVVYLFKTPYFCRVQKQRVLKGVMIEVKNISKEYRISSKRTVRALDDISFKVQKGEIFGIIGSSGAGKSTALRCLNLLERPDSGGIFIKGKDLTKLSERELQQERRRIGMIFQHFNLLSSRTIFDNVALPLELAGFPKKEIKSRVEDLLALVGLTDKATDYPSNLSGGQKQRVAIARALASNPDILLCDEATSALDPATTKSILRLLQSINRTFQLTIVLITHEIDVIKSICHRVGVIKDGRLIETGTTEEIFSDPKDPHTAQFVQNAVRAELPIRYQLALQNEYSPEAPDLLVRLGTKNHQDYAFSELRKHFQTEVSVIDAKIETVGKVSLGSFILLCKGTRLSESIDFLNTSFINVEIIGYVPRSL